MNDARSLPSVLVTGASGFIGGRIVARLRELGFPVAGTTRRDTVDSRLVRVDLADRSVSLAERFPDADVVVHCAARSSPWGTRREFERDNVEATDRVIDWVLQRPQRRLVFLSSSSVHYAAGHQHGLTETTPLPRHPVNRYAETKRQAERLITTRVADAIILRPRAVFGPGDTVLLPRILDAARAGRLPWLRADRPAVGDLIYIDNLVDIVERCCVDRTIRGTFNVTNDEPIEIEAFLAEVFRRLDIPLPRRRVSVRTAMLAATLLEVGYRLFRPSHEPPITRFGVHVFAWGKTFDVARAREVFGPPQISLEEGLVRTVDWFRRSSTTRGST
ncbi:MAG TPA: NAD-dependent epimerase/dehydratase family protein [Pirellulaceae bacterium]|nr:NAD-dependent epimerase/dehydratase family protein [Pirellulaceae bacterium]